MDRTSSFRRTLMCCLFQGAILAGSSAALAVAGCSGSTGNDGGPCSTDNPCAQGWACVFLPGSCQKGATGVCRTSFPCYDPPSGPVCGCDGTTVEAPNAVCAVWQTSLPYDYPAPCQVGTFPCGPMLQCQRNADVCVVTLPSMPGPASYACGDYDQVARGCRDGIPDCACIDTTPLGAPMSSCKADTDYQETVTVALP